MTWPQYRRQTCYVDGLPHRLTRSETDILSVLLMNYPRPLKLGEIVERVWEHPDREPEAAEESVMSLMARIRREIGPERIVSVSTLGFRVVQRPDVDRPYKSRRGIPGKTREQRFAEDWEKRRGRALRLATKMRGMAEELEALVGFIGPQKYREGIDHG